MENTIPELVSDKTFDDLQREGILDDKRIRNYRIRTEYRELRATKLKGEMCIEVIHEKYPYLQFDTIRKLVTKFKRRS